MSVLEEAAASLFSLIGNVTEQDTSIPPDELTKITDLIDNNEGILYKKDYYRSTPLANAIRSRNKHLIKVHDRKVLSSFFLLFWLTVTFVCTANVGIVGAWCIFFHICRRIFASESCMYPSTSIATPFFCIPA